jgi:hypothetical protein
MNQPLSARVVKLIYWRVYMLSIVSLDIYWSSYDYDYDYTYIQYIYIWSLIDGWLVGISGSISSSGHLLRSRHLLALFHLFDWKDLRKNLNWSFFILFIELERSLRGIGLIMCPIGLVCEMSIHWDQGQISMPFWLKIWPTLIDHFFWWAWDVLPTTSLCTFSYGKLRS